MYLDILGVQLDGLRGICQGTAKAFKPNVGSCSICKVDCFVWIEQYRLRVAVNCFLIMCFCRQKNGIMLPLREVLMVDHAVHSG